MHGASVGIGQLPCLEDAVKKKDFIATVDPGGRVRLRGAALLLVLAASALGQYPQHWLFKQPNLPRGGGALFEFAPASGAGMGTVCAGTIPTSAGGLAGTFTRASDAWCSKQGLASTGIANGDLVALTTNQPRIEPSGGVLGFRSEQTRVNTPLWSQQFDNATWNKLFSGVAAPVVTANAATAPDGTLTADRVQIAACPTSGNASVVTQNFTASAAAWSGSLFIRGNASSGNITLYFYNSTALAGVGINCSYNPDSWTWCGGPAAPLVYTFAHTTGRIGFGCLNEPTIPGGSGNTGAADIFAWQADVQLGAFPTSPITTTTTSATRAVDTGITYTVPAIGTSFGMAASVAFLSTAVGAVNIAALGPNGTSEVALYRNSNTTAGFDIGGTATTPTVPAIGITVHRAALRDTSGTRTAFWDASSVTAPAATMASTSTTVRIGAGPNAGSPGNTSGIVTLVQVDNNPTRVTP